MFRIKNVSHSLTAIAAFVWAAASLAQTTPPAESSEATPQSDVIAADALFRQGRELMLEQRYREACKSFAESNALDFAVGTQMNLALCYKNLGRTASAWSAYKSAAAAARDRDQTERQQIAIKEAAELEKQLNYVVFNVEAPVPELSITLDGTPIASALWSTLIPVDPGPHELVASAPGHEPRQVRIDARATSTQVVIEELTRIKLKPEPHPPVAPPSAQADMAEDTGAEAELGTAVYVAAGVTTALAVGVGITGYSYLEARSDFEDMNADSSASVSARRDKRGSAETLNVVNLILTGGTLVAAGITGYLWIDSKSSDGQPTGFRLKPEVSLDHASLSLTGEL